MGLAGGDWLLSAGPQVKRRDARSDAGGVTMQKGILSIAWLQLYRSYCDPVQSRTNANLEHTFTLLFFFSFVQDTQSHLPIGPALFLRILIR